MSEPLIGLTLLQFTGQLPVFLFQYFNGLSPTEQEQVKARVKTALRGQKLSPEQQARFGKELLQLALRVIHTEGDNVSLPEAGGGAKFREDMVIREILARMEQKGITMEQMASAIGCAPAALKDALSVVDPLPLSSEMVGKIAAQLGIEVAEIAFLDVPKRPNRPRVEPQRRTKPGDATN